MYFDGIWWTNADGVCAGIWWRDTSDRRTSAMFSAINWGTSAFVPPSNIPNSDSPELPNCSWCSFAMQNLCNDFQHLLNVTFTAKCYAFTDHPPSVNFLKNCRAHNDKIIKNNKSMTTNALLIWSLFYGNPSESVAHLTIKSSICCSNYQYRSHISMSFKITSSLIERRLIKLSSSDVSVHS